MNRLNIINTGHILALAVIILFAIGCSNESAETQQSKSSPAAVSDSTLQEKLDARKAAFAERTPPEMKKITEDALAEVAASGVLESAVNVGDTAPDFALPDPAGDTVVLSELLADGPVVLIWYRGGWCPYCNLQLQAMQDVLPRIHDAGAQMVAISPEIPDSAMSTTARSDLGYHVVSDVGLQTSRRYGIVYTMPESLQELYPQWGLDLGAYNDGNAAELPLAVTYVVDQSGVVRYAFVDADYKKRAEPADIVAVLEQM